WRRCLASQAWFNVTFPALRDDRRHESGSRGKTVQTPAAVVPGLALDAEDLGRLAGREGDVEAIERMVETVANRLNEGFLARPAIAKPQRPVAPVDRNVRLVLAAGEEARPHVVGAGEHTDGLGA